MQCNLVVVIMHDLARAAALLMDNDVIPLADARLPPDRLAALLEDAQADWWRSAAAGQEGAAAQPHPGWTITGYDTDQWQQVWGCRNGCKHDAAAAGVRHQARVRSVCGGVCAV